MTGADLKCAAKKYLATRRSLGLNDKRHRKVLADFCDTLASRKFVPANLAQEAFQWACSTPQANATTSQALRLSIVRSFLCYVKTIIPETEVPSKGLIKGYRRRPPYIFSSDEISRLLDLAASLTPCGSLRPQTYQTIIGLLSCTGLRASETVRLKISDVQLNAEPPRLLISETKFRKSRWVPIHTTSAEALESYRLQRCAYTVHANPTEAFFASNKGRAIPYCTLKNVFTRLIDRSSMVTKKGQRGPCLHSLRHTFAVHRLTSWYREGNDVQDLAPHLSVYLGHAQL